MYSIFIDDSGDYIGLVIGDQQVIKNMLNKALQRKYGRPIHMKKLSK